MRALLVPHEVDRLLRYPRGRSVRLAKAGKLPHVILPDGGFRFYQDDIERLLSRRDENEQQAVEITTEGALA